MKVVKNVVLSIGILGVLFTLFFTFQIDTQFHSGGYCYQNYTRWCEHYQNFLALNFYNGDNLAIYLSPLILMFSLITYRMRENIFNSWIRFSVIFVPILVIAMFVFPGGHNGFGAGAAISDVFDGLMLTLLFAIYIVTSIVIIVKVHRKA